MVDVALMSQLLRAIPDNAPSSLSAMSTNALRWPGGCAGGHHCLRAHSDGTTHRNFSPGSNLANHRQCSLDESGATPRDAEDGTSDFYVFRQTVLREIQAKLLRVVTNGFPSGLASIQFATCKSLTPMNRGSLGARALNAVLPTGLES